MKTPIIILFLCATLSVLTGCSTPKYKGEGQIADTSTWYMIFRQPEYTIRLASFGLNTNITQELNLGDVAFFRKTRISVRLQFMDDHEWASFTKDAYIVRSTSEYPWRDTDTIQSRLSFRVSTETGQELFQSDKLLRDYRWTQGFPDPQKGYRIGIFAWPLISANIAKGTNLKVWFSYSGDPSLTNRGEFVVLCSPGIEE